MSSATCSPLISDEHLSTFRREGAVILPRLVAGQELAALRAGCDAEVARQDAEMAARGVQVEGINHHKRRYFIPHAHDRHAALRDFAFSETMAAVVRNFLSDTAQLFLEQFVVKAGDAGTKFGWHQDSGYVGYPHREYLTCWLALDDVSEANGTIRILPWSRVGGDPRAIPVHRKEEGTNDMIGYEGDDPGDPVIVPAGSMAVFSSRTFHRSTANLTNELRRAWLLQYTAEPMYRPDGSLQIRAEPFLDQGRIVAVTQ
jgi:ectoine hydroxylase-related dioxygenase (phytanoyl-CoA dioxygenase family)